MSLTSRSIVFLLSILMTVEKSSGEESATVASVNAVASIEDVAGLVYVAKVDLGPLLQKTQYNVNVTIRNSIGRDLRIGKIESSCYCIRPEVSSQLLTSDGTIQLTWRLDTKSPNLRAMGNLKSGGRISLMPETSSENRIDIRFEFTFSQSLEFLDSYFMAGIEPRVESEFKIPFVFSDPITFNSLELAASEFAEGVHLRLESTESGGVIVGKVRPNDMIESSVGGPITIICTSTSETRDVYCVLTKIANATVSPKFVFIRLKEGDSHHRGSAIIRLAATDDKSPETLPLVTCSLDGIPVNVEVKRLGGPTYRVTYSLSRELIDGLQLRKRESPETPVSELSWEIHHAGHVDRINTALNFGS